MNHELTPNQNEFMRLEERREELERGLAEKKKKAATLSKEIKTSEETHTALAEKHVALDEIYNQHTLQPKQETSGGLGKDLTDAKNHAALAAYVNNKNYSEKDGRRMPKWLRNTILTLGASGLFGLNAEAKNHKKHKENPERIAELRKPGGLDPDDRAAIQFRADERLKDELKNYRGVYGDYNTWGPVAQMRASIVMDSPPQKNRDPYDPYVDQQLVEHIRAIADSFGLFPVEGEEFGAYAKRVLGFAEQMKYFQELRSAPKKDTDTYRMTSKEMRHVNKAAWELLKGMVETYYGTEYDIDNKVYQTERWEKLDYVNQPAITVTSNPASMPFTEGDRNFVNKLNYLAHGQRVYPFRDEPFINYTWRVMQKWAENGGSSQYHKGRFRRVERDKEKRGE